MKAYIEKAMVTNKPDYSAIAEKMKDQKTVDLLHACMGIDTEGGELTDVIKKHLFYGKDIDEVNATEEIGDLLWYIAVMCKALGISFEDCAEINISKLKKRYPDGFKEEAAINRDIASERALLEKEAGK